MSPQRPRGFGRIFRRPNQPNGDLWIAYYSHGGERRESVKKVLGKLSITERDAERLLDRRLREKLAGQAPPTKALTVKQLCTAYAAHCRVKGIRGLARHLQAVKQVVEWLGHERADQLTLPRLEQAVAEYQTKEYVVRKERRRYSPGTIKTRLYVLHAALAYGHAHLGLPPIPAFPKLRVANTRYGLIDEAELERIVAHLPEPAQDAVAFGSLTGWRVGEVRGLTWGRVDLQAGLVRLDTSKTGEGRVRPLVEPELRTLLEKRWRLRAIGCHFVFHRDGRPLSDTWLGTAWRKACARAGLPGRYFHDLRRSAYRDLVSRAGVDLVTAMELVGHKSLNVAKRYNVVETGRLTRALDLVTRMRAGQVSDNSRTAGPAEPPARSS